MSKKPVRIALDILGDGYLEQYRLQVFRGVVDYARCHTNWEIIFRDAVFSLTRAFERYEDLKGLRVNGLISRVSADTAQADRLHALGLPVVNIQSFAVDDRFPSVRPDNREIGRMVARHFLEKGYRNFGYCGPRNWRWARTRAEGFSQILQEAGCICQFHMPDCQDAAPDSPTSPMRSWTSPQEIHSWLAQIPKPAGVIACHDTAALCV
ncbi:substrate-binding domain-containing protein, partial [bacterium]|nr:substrate-binding domain-containing protein [bacterium]